MPNPLTRVVGAGASFPTWAPLDIKSLNDNCLRIINKRDDIFGPSLLEVHLLPDDKVSKPVEYIKPGPVGIINVYLGAYKEGFPELLIFRVANEMAQLIRKEDSDSKKEDQDRIGRLVYCPGGRTFERDAKACLRETVGQLPHHIKHKEAYALLKNNMKKNQQMIDFYKFLYLLIEPLPRPANAVAGVSAGLLNYIELNVKSETLGITQSPWEYLRLMGVFSVLTRQLEQMECVTRCYRMLNDAEFCHNLLLLENADQALPFNKGKSIDPSPEEAQQRFRAIFDFFLLAAEGYYDAAKIRLPA